METKTPSSSSQNIRFTRKTIVLITVGALMVVAAGAYFTLPSAEADTAEPAVQTARVRTGDLIVTASGAGTVVPASEVDLGFRSGGVLTELNVSVGDAVESAEVLARLEENIQAEADFQALFTPLGVMQAEGEVSRAYIALDDAIDALMYLISPQVYHYELKLAEAQSLFAALDSDSSASQEAVDEAGKNLERAENNLKYAQSLYINEYVPATFSYTWIDEETGESVTEAIPPSPADVTLARANLESARMLVRDAEAALEIVKAGPETLTKPLAALGPQMAKLEQARLAVESTRLTAPFDGTVTSLNAVVGQTVGTSPILSLTTTQDLLVRFYLDETDVDKVAVGNRVTFTFDAYPDLPMEGEVFRVEPTLQMVDGTPVVVVWAKLPDETASSPQGKAGILSGMTVDAEVISGEVRGALIVPIQALRELSPGSYAVFVVGADGELKLTPVEVGMRDYANAEILSGLNAGDLVSTGNVETK